MRFYGFCHYFLSPMQQALQAAHVIAEIGAAAVATQNYNNNSTRLFHSWATQHKTIVLLNGGNSDNILTTFRDLILPLNLPSAVFFEDQESLNGAATCAGVVVPTDIVELISLVREEEWNGGMVEDRLDAIMELLGGPEMITNEAVARQHAFKEVAIGRFVNFVAGQSLAR